MLQHLSWVLRCTRWCQGRRALAVAALLVTSLHFSSAQSISVGPGQISTVASQTNELLRSAHFNGVVYKASTGTLYVADARSVGTVSIANIYAVNINTGQVTRVAGTAPAPGGNAGFGGDNGAAINAQLNSPQGLALDSAGNLYISDCNATNFNQSRIRKIDASTGVITTIAGGKSTSSGLGDGGAATDALFTFPTGMAFASNGDLYIADTLGSRVRMISASNGVINTVAGNGVPGYTGDNGSATNAQLNLPSSTAVDSAGNLYIADRGNHVVRQVSGGTITTIAGQGGSAGFSGDGGPGISASLSTPYGLVADAAGGVYIVDSGNNRVRKLSNDGSRTISTIAGNGIAGYSGDGGSALSATLNGPSNVAINAATGDLYFIDNTTFAVRKVTSRPAPAIFPLTAVGSTASTNLVVSNTGNQTLSITQMNPPTNFTITGGTCGGAPFTLSAGTSCTLIVQFNPTNGGPTSGTLNIVSNSTTGSTTPVFLWESNGLYFVPLANPCRVVDTRVNDTSNGGFGTPFLSANSTRAFAIRNSTSMGCGSLPVPSNANVQAYSLNVTVVPLPGRSLSFLTVWPGNSSRPDVSLLNAYDGRTKANAIIVPADTSRNDRPISVFGTADTDVIIDINGYYVPESTPSSLAYYPVPPCRLADTRDSTRNANSLGTPSMEAGETRTFALLSGGCNLPSSAKAYALNYTAVPLGSPLAYLTTWPAGPSTRPVVSTLNATTGAVTANAAIVPAGTNGGVTVYTTNKIDLIIDVSGYYADPAPGGLALYNATPCRSYDSRAEGSGVLINGVKNVNVASACGVSAAAQSLVLNATVIPQASLSYITNWAYGSAQPIQSTLNAYDSAVTSNLAVAPTNDGQVSTFTTASTGLILDLFAYFAP